MKYDIIIIGGGPAGMMAAISAANQNSKVCLLEHKDRVGKKILSTGNGKCNLTNMQISPDCYRSDSKESYFCVIEKFPPKMVVDYFHSIGMLTKERNGYVYPLSEQAATVLDTLRAELSHSEVDVFTETEIKSIDIGFTVKTDKGTYHADRLILACGSKCASKTGSDGSGYSLAKKLGHKIINPIPSLVQLKCRENFFKELSGVRTEAELTVRAGGNELVRDTGEVQFTDYGISGIPTFQISRYVKRAIDNNSNPIVKINLLVGYTEQWLAKELHAIFTHDGNKDVTIALNGIFNKKLAMVLLKLAGIRPGTLCKEIHESDINALVHVIGNFKVTPFDTTGFENAQVCAGGVSLDEIDLNTMESKLVKGLYMAGEMLDVDGKCGGYNLQWAFASGRLAGISAAGADND